MRGCTCPPGSYGSVSNAGIQRRAGGGGGGRGVTRSHTKFILGIPAYFNKIYINI